MLKHLPRSGMDFLLHVFNLSWSSQSFPSIWKTSSIIPIQKMGKPLNSPASFWPISLTSCISKLFERIILSRLLFFLESNSILFPRQAGFALDGQHLIKFCTFLSPFRMGLTNPGQVLRRSSLLLISPKLFTLSGIPPFSINSFWLASLLALLIGLNLFFLIGALLWFIKITKVVPFESVEVFRKNPFLALYFCLSSSMIFWLLCLLPSAVLFTLMIWPFGPPPLSSPLRWRPHKELCFNWIAGLSTGVFLSILAHVRLPSSQWIPTRLISSPTSSYSSLTSVSIPLQLFLGHLRPHSSFSKHVSSLKVKFFPCLKALHCISASSWGPSKESLSLLYKSFLRSFFTYASPGWFPILSATNFTKLESLHRAASRAITSCLSSSPIPLLLSEASLPPLRVTLTHFTLLFYERALRLPTSFPISGLARLGVKPRLSRSSWRAFAFTHPLMLPSTCSREALLACPRFPPWNLPSFTVESTLSSSCSCSDPLFSLAKVQLSPTLALSPLMIWCFGQTALFLFLLSRAAPAFLPTALSVALRPLFPFW